ncbi:hypothetical protein RB595_001394 [Gaeumannomyces hyphopodioides]
MRYPSISAFLLATTLPTAMSASVRLDSPSETGGHVSRRRLAEELDTPTREELSALDADEAGGGGGSNSPIARDPPTFVLRRTNSDGQSVSSDSAGSALSDADLASILAVSGGSSVYERSIDGDDEREGRASAQSWASRRRRSLSALVRRACRPTHHGQDPKYRHSGNCERSASPTEADEAEAEAPDQQIRSLVSDKPTFEGAAKEVFYSHEAKRGVAGWVSRRRARSNASA